MSYNNQYSNTGQPYNNTVLQTPTPWSNGYSYGYNQHPDNNYNFGFKVPNKSEYLGSGLSLNPDTLTNKGMQYAQNNANGVASDTSTQTIDYSLYGEGFSKEFIDQMLNDTEFQKILNEYIIPNEGGYSNRLNDRGKKNKLRYFSEDLLQ